MSDETLSVTLRIGAPPEAVFAVLADPGRHAAVDGTGWVRDPIEAAPLTGVGQVFRMAMHHGSDYETANQVDIFDPPRAIGWGTGAYDADGNLGLGGWTWRYDLKPVGDGQTEVSLTYDWSQVGPSFRERIPFPPFDPSYLQDSLEHLAELATAG